MSTLTVEAVTPPQLHGGPPATTERPRAKLRRDIQGLRAVAVLLVVLYHAGVPGIRGGYVGVDVFFVISGFLITSRLKDEADTRQRISFARFYGARMRRLLPPAALVMIFTVAMARWVLPVTQAKSVVKDVFYAAIYGINYHLAVEGVQYQNAAAPPSPLQHFWSLAVEEQFYIVWPLLIGLCLLVGRRRGYQPLMVAAIALLSGVTLFASIMQTPHDTSMAYFSIHTRAWELGAGALLALSADRLWLPQWLRSALVWGGLATIVVTAFAYTEKTLYPGSAAVLPVLGSVAVLAAGTRGSVASAERLLGHGAMQYAGKVSYGWYLWHWPLLILLSAWAGRSLMWPYKLEIVFLGFWAAVLTYFLEDAARRHSLSARGWLSAGGAISAVTALSALLVLLSLPNLVGHGAAWQTTALASDSEASVQSAINASLATRQAPSNLTPALSRVLTDDPITSNNGCHLDFFQTQQPECLFGDPQGTKTMVLVGDSHAQQWFGALNQIAKVSDYRLYAWTKSACPIADVGTVYAPQLGRAYNECNAWRRDIEQRVRSLNPTVIVTSQSDAVTVGSVTDDRWAQDTVAGLERMAGSSSRIAYLEDTPKTKDDPVACLEKKLDDVQACTYPVSQAFFSMPQRHSVLQTALTGAGIRFFPTLQYFCSPGGCPAIVGNMVVRRDTGHATNTYVTWLAPALTPLFKD